MERILTYDSQFRSRYAADNAPLKVKIEEVAAANLAYSITRSSTEIDPIAVRRAFEHANVSAGDWAISDAVNELRIGASRGVRMIPVSTAPYYAWAIFNEADSGGGAQQGSTLTYATLQSSLGSSGSHQASAIRVFNLSKPIVMPYLQYRPFQITVFVQGHTQTTQAVGLVMICAGVTPVDANARWFAIPTHNNNTISFGVARIPTLTPPLNGFVGGSGSDNMVCGCVQVFPFPSLAPSNFDGTAATSNWNYYIFPGFANRTTSALRHPYMCVTVDAEVL